jgi:hypothetical protein
LLSHVGATSSYRGLIEGNTITNVFRTGVGIAATDSSFVSIKNNEITNIIPVGMIPARAIRGGASAAASSLCLDIENNVSPDGADIGVVGAGSVSLEPFTGNSGTLTTGGGVVVVADGACGF